jgi:hypothetical protein
MTQTEQYHVIVLERTHLCYHCMLVQSLASPEYCKETDNEVIATPGQGVSLGVSTTSIFIFFRLTKLRLQRAKHIDMTLGACTVHRALN